MATSSTQSGFVDSWQSGKSVIECNLHMLETEDFTDVTFLIGSEKHVVRAHRYVLASRSCVFHAMFCGRMAEQREKIIPDIEVNVFRDFLRFLYTDDVPITSDNVTGLMYAARKYDVETLFEKSTSFLENSLSEENLCQILEESHEYGETDLEQQALKMLQKSSSAVTTSSAFLDLCSRCFGTFLKSENLNMKEEEIFEALIAWTRAECDREGLRPSHENMRNVLGEMVYEISFTNLSLEFLTKVVGPSGILTAEERIRIVDIIMDSNLDVSPFCSVDRKNRDIGRDVHDSGVVNVVRRFNRYMPVHVRFARTDSLSFSTNKPITLLGFQLYGSDRETNRIDVALYDDQNQKISHPVQDTDWTLTDNVNDIMFPAQVPIKAGSVYTLFVDVRAGNFRYGTGGQTIVSEAGVVFTFKDSNYSAVDGMIPGLIWRF